MSTEAHYANARYSTICGQTSEEVPEAFQGYFTNTGGPGWCLGDREPPTLEPVFWQAKEGHVIAMDWCEGFMDAYALRSDGWDALMRTDEGREWMFPIFAHLIDEDGNSLVGARQDKMDALVDKSAEQIPVTVPHIFKFWQSSRIEKRLN